MLVVGSINVDLYQRLDGGKAKFSGKPLSIAPIKGMTLPAASFVGTPAVKAKCKAGAEEAFVRDALASLASAGAAPPAPPPAHEQSAGAAPQTHEQSAGAVPQTHEQSAGTEN